MTPVDVLVPTFQRPAALAVTLASLVGQSYDAFRVVVSDQSEERCVFETDEVCAVLRVLEARGHPVETHRHLPRRGLAEHRQFLLDRCTARYALFLDDDLILEPDMIARLVAVIERERCGFVGSAPIGLSHAGDVRPDEQAIELWDGPVEPEEIVPGSEAWQRHRLHNAANIFHLQRRLGLSPAAPRAYRVAWVGGCALHDAAKLRAVGGFSFWPQLPDEHAGEDVLVQLRVMARFGGCAVIPSGVYHQELRTTVENRAVDAPRALELGYGAGGSGTEGLREAEEKRPESRFPLQ